MALVAQVLGGSQLEVQAGMLKHDPDARPYSPRIQQRIAIQYSYRAVGGFEKCGKNAEKRRFTSAVRAEHAIDFPLLNSKIDPVQRNPIAVTMSQSGNGYGRRH